MEGNLTFKLDKPIEKLIPQMIGFNNTELLNKAKEISNFYSNAVYSEEQIKDAKNDKAKINNLIKAINSARIDVRKTYESPYMEFKQKIDEVVNCLQESSDVINSQLSEFEKKRQEKKRSDIEAYFKDAVGIYGDFVKLTQIFNNRWLNASYSMKNVQLDIENQMLQIQKDIDAIQSLNSENEVTLKALYFRSLDLGKVLVEHERLNNEKKRIQEAEKAKTEQTSQPAQIKEQTVTQPSKSEPVKNITQTNLYNVTLEFKDMTYEQATELLAYIQQNKLSYERIG